MKKFLLILMFCFLAAVKAFASLTATVSNNTPAIGEPFDLTIESDEDVSQKPDLSVLGDDFNVISTSVSHQSYVVNGQSSHSTKFIIGLIATKAGNLKIPAIRVQNEFSSPISLNVQEDNSSIQVSTKPNKTAKSSQPYTLSSEVIAPENAPYVQEQITYAVRLTDNKTIESGDIAFEQTNDFIIKSLGKPEVKEFSNKREVTYLYALFAQKSGQLTLPVAHFEGVSYDKPEFEDIFEGGFFQIKIPSIFGFQTPIRLTSKAQKINILPVPETYQGNWWLPAENVSLSGEFVGTQRRFVEGQPAIFNLEISATGLVQTQLPDIFLKQTPNLKQYVEEKEQKTDLVNGKIVSSKKMVITYIPLKSGEIKIPEISVDWFNLQTKTVEKAFIAEKTITADPNLNAQTNAAPTQNQNNIKEKVSSSSMVYLWLALAFLAGVILSKFMFQKNAKPKEKKPSDETIVHAAKEGNLKNLRDEILALARQKHPNKNIKNLKDVADLTDDSDFKKQIDLLTKALYDPKSNIVFESKPFIKTFKKVLQKRKKEKTEKQPLPPLYR